MLVCAVAFTSAAYVLKTEANNWKGGFEKMMADWEIPQAELRAGDKTIVQLNKEVEKLTQDLVKAKEDRDKWQRAVDDKIITIGLRDTEIAKLQGQIAKLQTSEERLRDDVGAIKTQLTEQLKTNTRLDVENKAAQLAKDAAEKAQRKAEDELAHCQDDLRNLRDQLKLTKGDLKTSVDLLNRYGDTFGEEGKRLAGAAKTPQVPINGLVRRADNKAGIILISVGKGDDVATGMTFEVVRGTRYVGRIRVTDVFDEEAICRVVLPLTHDPIREGDYVTTRIQ